MSVVEVLSEKLMADQRSSNIAYHIDIDTRLKHLPPIPSEPYIFKVPKLLRRVNEESYEPEIIAIGPYHHDKNHLQAMEEHKWHSLRLLLERRKQDSAEGYVQEMRKLEERARRCYAESITLKTDKFVEMMLLDGCFIVELIRKGTAKDLKSDNDPIFKLERKLFSLKHDMLLLKHDMLLLENQLPFFILKTLFDMTLMPGQESNFIELIFEFFRMLPGQGYKRVDQPSFQDIPHLLGLMHDNWLPDPEGLKAYKNTREKDTQSSRCLVLWRTNCGRKRHSKKDDDTQSHIRCASELKEAGIKFKRAEGCSLFDIRFENDTLRIPKLTVGDGTESLLRNFIAYEQFSEVSDVPYHVIDYTMFMDCLIDTKKDVELLCRCGIIENYLGDDDVVATLFNKLLNNVSLYNEKSYYADTYEQVNKHRNRQWNVWMAKLRHDYFNSPWALISFLAAFLLLLLTLVQTLYTVLSYYNSY